LISTCSIFKPDLVLEALKNYIRRKESDLNRLYKVAKECKIDRVIEPYIKAMVIE
jgi:hypothetical protein